MRWTEQGLRDSLISPHRRQAAESPAQVHGGDSPCTFGKERALFLRLLLLLTIVPLVELVILLRLAEWLRWDGTIALVLLTGVLGAWLARHEGLKALDRIQTDLAAGVTPAAAVVDGVLILVAGLVLVTPGVLTDLCGFALLVPPIRRWIGRRLAAAFKRRVRRADQLYHHERETFIDVEATSREADEEADRLSR